MNRLGGLGVIMMTACGLGACGTGGAHGGKDPKTAGAGAPVISAQGGAACKAPSAAEPLTKNAGASSTVALAKVGTKRVAFVADEDSKSILTMDIDGASQIAETRLDGTPGQIWIASDGRVLATLRDKAQIVVLSAARADAPLTRLCNVQTAPEPVSIAATPDESTILVASGWGQRLTAFDASTLATKFEAPLSREPRAVVVTDDGKNAYISHAVGSVMSVVELATAKHETRTIAMRGFEAGQLNMIKQQRDMIEMMKKQQKTNPAFKQQADMFAAMDHQTKRLMEGRQSCQGFALAKSTAAVPGRVFAPEVLVDPGDFEQRPDGYGSDRGPTEVPAVAVIDESAAEPLMSSITIMDSRRASFFRKRQDAREEHPECLLPRAAVIDAKTKSLLVTCFGIDAVVAYDATAANPFGAERRRWTVGSGPNGIAVDEATHRGVVWSQFDRTLSTFPIGGGELVDEKTAPVKVQKTAASALSTKLPAEYALGRILFHATGDTRISGDGRACASCHPDGRDDAITWATPEGPRRSIMLAGRASRTAPYSWNGNESSLHGHLGNTFDRLSGKGLRSIELDALVTYISEMPAPQTGTILVTDAKDKAKVERGRAIFNSSEAQCSSCHAGATFTDGKNHEVGSKHKADRAGAFNTPSLHLIGGTGPYFHDGRYSTLSELLTKSDGTMGRTKHLTNADLDALETFLKTL